MRPVKPERRAYCFTLDDNIRFLEESSKSALASVFQHPYMELFWRMHQKYGAKFQFNMYYSYEPGGFSLAEVPDRWKEELEENAQWLRFSFHARHNDPPFPYAHSSSRDLLKDYTDVMTQLRRIAGKAATDATTTLHYVCATREACAALQSRGMRGLIGMFLPEQDRAALRYYLTEEQSAWLRRYPLCCDEDTRLIFAKNDVVLNSVPLEEIEPALRRIPKDFYHIMIHEQYFYPDYCNWQPDFSQKVEAPLKLFQEMGLPSCFLEEII